MENNIPAHIAVIPDGNRRWAKKRGLAAMIGHEKGIERFNEVSEAAFERGVKFFTIWAGSEDNLIKRSPQEVAHLVKHLRQEIERQLASGQLEKRKIRFRLSARPTSWSPERGSATKDASLFCSDTTESKTCFLGYRIW